MNNTLLQALENARRERSRFKAPVLPPDEDYAAAGILIERAVEALRESLPNGQKLRTELALLALAEGFQKLLTWAQKAELRLPAVHQKWSYEWAAQQVRLDNKEGALYDPH